MPSTINSDNGVVSGSAGVKTTADTSGELALQSNGVTGLTLNTSLAIGVGSGNSRGTSGQVLTSAGSGAAPTWATPTPQAYPGAGIPNSTGSAWGTSYSITGTGSVVALATSPTFVTPVLGTPTSGTLSNCTVDGTSAVGYLNIPQNSQSAAYTLVASDAGKHIFHPAADNNARTFTIPANSSVAYPIGTAITFINMAAANVTIAITSDTLTLSPAGTTGSRTLATNGSATCIKITSTQWLISGSALT